MLSVIIGRFQTNQLHEGHLDLIRQAKAATGHDILVLIGTTAAAGTDKNPLSFELRKHLFDIHISFSPILPLEDMASDKDWSDKIDGIIEDLGYDEALIWGGRDNGIEGYYTGKHKIRIIEQRENHSSTAIRKNIAKQSLNCSNFRAGIIHHIENRYPIVYSTVDVAIYRLDDFGNLNSVLMGKKGDKFCFPGGFIDPQDENLHQAAFRELKEETGITQDYLEYIFSYKVNDARYKGTKDCIMTHFFAGSNHSITFPDSSKISDKEFKEFTWIPATEKSLDLISDTHKPLFLKFINSKN
jgi:bifunctional NMN adenylyltransferase/nudix hydrolase